MVYVFITYLVLSLLLIMKLIIDLRISVQRRNAVEAFRLQELDKQSQTYRKLAKDYNLLLDNRNKLKEMFTQLQSEKNVNSYAPSNFSRNELIAIRNAVHPDKNKGRNVELTAKLNELINGA